ncbi:hypothetical protein RvY_12561-1 [Ramazzottius varieornatus]|uniref:Uncharacterized protein n=1 Tax=Ramazzottius varieornatus TaxID=947166 RepID=A0A1D1VJY8_RAMVA|nr:hypothetical protein RvY_12561-1 [Ramazzottius varieornatus]
MKSQAELCTALAFTVMLACCSSGFVSAWHPDKKIAKWDPSFFQPVIYRACGRVGSPCGQRIKHFGISWRPIGCCSGLECVDVGHGSFCAEPLDLTDESEELSSNSEELAGEDSSTSSSEVPQYEN